MNLEFQRRLTLPLIGCALSVGAYLAMARPATAETSVVQGYTAIWNAQAADAVQPMLKALRLDPASPERWTDLAEAFYENGRTADARYCTELATRLAPRLPHIAMRAAGMYVRLGDPAAGLRETNRVVGETTDYDAIVFQFWQRLGGTARDVYRWGAGTNLRAGRGYFRYLAGSGDTGAAGDAWKELEAGGMAGEEEARAYANLLTSAHEYEQAASIEARILPRGVADGGFETDWTGQTPGWQADPAPGVTASRDESTHYSGNASLRLEFDGSNRNEYNVIQTRALPPGVWRLRAMMRSELKSQDAQAGGSPAPGPALRIVDRDQGRVLGETNRRETPGLDASHDWMPVEATAAVGPAATLVQLEIVRPATPDSAFSMAGTVWVDDVTLTAAPGAPRGRQ